MKNKILTLFLGLMLLTDGWLVAQQALWWDDPPPPGSAPRDHSISYGNGFAWQVALGTAESEDVGHDAIAVSSGGYLVVGSNYFYDGYTAIKSELVLYRLTEEGDLMWEKGFSFEDYEGFVEVHVVENPNESFFIVGIIRGGSNPRKCFLLNVNFDGDEVYRHTWLFSEGNFSKLRIAKGDDNTFFVSCWRVTNGWQQTEVYKLNSNLDTLMYLELPYFEFLHKTFGFSCTGGSYEQVRYYYNLTNDLSVLDSFPDPIGVFNPAVETRYPMQSLRNGRNVFFRTVTTFPRVFKMATTTEAGEVLNVNPDCFNGNDIWWYKHAGGWNYPPHEFSDGSICVPYNFYFDWNDNYSIGLVKLNSQGQLLGDTAMSRSAGSMMLVKVLEGADGRPIVFGTGENGPLGRRDIFIAKLASWNPVGVPMLKTAATQPLRVYPNPTNDSVEVTIPTGTTKGTLSVTTLSGHIVHSQAVMDNRAITLSAARWPTGLLIVSLTTPDRVFTAKLIKN